MGIKKEKNKPIIEEEEKEKIEKIEVSNLPLTFTIEEEEEFRKKPLIEKLKDAEQIKGDKLIQLRTLNKKQNIYLLQEVFDYLKKEVGEESISELIRNAILNQFPQLIKIIRFKKAYKKLNYFSKMEDDLFKAGIRMKRSLTFKDQAEFRYLTTMKGIQNVSEEQRLIYRINFLMRKKSAEEMMVAHTLMAKEIGLNIEKEIINRMVECKKCKKQIKYLDGIYDEDFLTFYCKDCYKKYFNETGGNIIK